MEKNLIIEKFGSEFLVDEETFKMGIHHQLVDSIVNRFLGSNTVLDSCCGAGMTTVHLAKYVDQVVAVDVDPVHLEQAKENVKIAGVEDKVTFILGDILSNEVLDQLPNLDGAFLDPDWSKASDPKSVHTSDLSLMQPAGDKLFAAIYQKTPNIAFRLPKEFTEDALKGFPKYDLEENILDGKLKFYTAYFGGLIG